MSQVFFDELGLAEPRYRLDLRTADPEAMTRADPRASSRRASPTGCSSTATRTRRSPGAHAAGERAGRARRGGAAQLRPVDAGGAEPDRGRPAARRCCSAPTSAPPRQLEREGVAGRSVEVVGDVMADATRLFAPLAASARRARRLGSSRAATPSLTRPPRGERTEPERLRRIVEGLNRVAAPLRLPRAPAHPARARASSGSTADTSSDRAARLPRHRRARVASAGVIVTDSGGLQKEAYWYARPVRDDAPEHRMGRHRRGRRERPRRAGRPRGRDRRGALPRRRARALRRRARRASASRLLCTLERRVGHDPTATSP